MTTLLILGILLVLMLAAGSAGAGRRPGPPTIGPRPRDDD